MRPVLYLGDIVDIDIWSIVETNVSIICASLPALKPLLAHIFPRLVASTGGAADCYQMDRCRPSNHGISTIISGTCIESLRDNTLNKKESTAVLLATTSQPQRPKEVDGIVITKNIYQEIA